MAYIGNPPAERFTSFDYQDLTGGTGTSFTLTHPVGNAQEILVMVNNVVQEPGVAYTVSGTALTMTGSIVAADDFYVVYRGKAIQTATHPSDRALTATDGTFTGDLTAPNLISESAALVLESNKASTERKIEFGNDYFGPDSGDDNAIDLGRSGARFNDIFLGGGAYIGGTGNANKLDDYEETSFSPTLEGQTTAGSSPTGTGRATKIGRAVIFNILFANVTVSGAAGLLVVRGMPFVPDNNVNNVFPIASYKLEAEASFSVATLTGGSTNVEILHIADDGIWDNANIINTSNIYLYISGVYTT